MKVKFHFSFNFLTVERGALLEKEVVGGGGGLIKVLRKRRLLGQGVLIRAGVLIRENTIYQIITVKNL